MNRIKLSKNKFEKHLKQSNLEALNCMFVLLCVQTVVVPFHETLLKFTQKPLRKIIIFLPALILGLGGEASTDITLAHSSITYQRACRIL